MLKELMKGVNIISGKDLMDYYKFVRNDARFIYIKFINKIFS